MRGESRYGAPPYRRHRTEYRIQHTEYRASPAEVVYDVATSHTTDAAVLVGSRSPV